MRPNEILFFHVLGVVSGFGLGGVAFGWPIAGICFLGLGLAMIVVHHKVTEKERRSEQERQALARAISDWKYQHPG